MSERRTSTSKSRQAGTWAGSRSETQSESTKSRASIPARLREINDHKELIIITGQPVIKARKIRDYRDRILRKRLNLPLPPDAGCRRRLPRPATPQPDASVWSGVMVKPTEIDAHRGQSRRCAGRG